MSGGPCVVARNARPTDTGAVSRRGAGVDVDVTVTWPGGEITEGEVTLLPAEDGSPCYERWGMGVDHWMSGNLVDECQDYRRDFGHEAYCDLLASIEGKAAEEAGRP